MATMDAFSVYRYYLAMKLHFTTDKYDIVSARGRVRASEDAFNKRRDLWSIKKIAEKYNNEEVVKFLVANFVSGDRWGGIFDSNARERYIRWKGKQERLLYDFKNELEELYQSAEIDGIMNPFIGDIGQHPHIIRQYMAGNISLESLVIINKIKPFLEKFDENLSGDMMWPDIKRLIAKYSPFVRIKHDREKFERVLTEYSPSY